MADQTVDPWETAASAPAPVAQATASTPDLDPWEQAPASAQAKSPLATFIDQLGEHVAVPGRPDLNLNHAAEWLTSFIPGQGTVAEQRAQDAASNKENPLAATLGEGAGRLTAAYTGGQVARALLAPAEAAGLGAGTARTLAQATGGAAALPEHPGIGAAGGALLSALPEVPQAVLKRIPIVGEYLTPDVLAKFPALAATVKASVYGAAYEGVKKVGAALHVPGAGGLADDAIALVGGE